MKPKFVGMAVEQRGINATNVVSPLNSKLEKTFKVIVIGDSNVGKTSLTYRLVSSIIMQRIFDRVCCTVDSARAAF